MRVPPRLFADRELIGQIAADRSLEQLQNVATLPARFLSEPPATAPDSG
jgi:RNA-splicing ligase RtcB